MFPLVLNIKIVLERVLRENKIVANENGGLKILRKSMYKKCLPR